MSYPPTPPPSPSNAYPTGWPTGRGGKNAPYPTGWPGAPKGTEKPSDTDKAKTASDPGKFHWGDALGLVVYIGGFLLGGMLLLFTIPGVTEFGAQLYGHQPVTFDEVLAADPVPAWFVMYSNVILYGIAGIILFAVSWRPFIQSFRWFKTWWGLKLGLLPVIWVATLLLTAFILVISGQGADVSANQEAVQEAAGESSLLMNILILGLVGPFVEEYIFRHLLIGKLGRKVPVWITVPISIVAFTMLHFIGDPNMSFASVLPYMSMAIAFTAVYLFSKKSLAYAWLSHAFNNIMAVILMEFQYTEISLIVV